MAKKYFIMQLKRAGKLFPSVLLSGALLLLSLGMLAFMIFSLDDSEERNRKIRIGLVGNPADSYLGIGIGVMQNMDASRFSIDFIEMDESEAKKQLASGEIAGYILVPEEFIEALGRGENIPLTYVSAVAGSGLSDQIIREIADIASVTIWNSERAIYAMQDYMTDFSYQNQISEATDKMNLKLIDITLNRNNIYDIEIIGAFDRIPLTLYYFTGMFIFFLLIWGINGSLFLLKKDMDLYRLLAARGCGSFFQVIGEYGAFFFLLLSLSLALLLSGKLILYAFGLGGGKWGIEIGTGNLILMIIPVILLIASIHFLLYECISGLIASVLSSFILSISLSYISGYFYPISFFPDSIQQLSKILPTGIALRYLQNGIYFGQIGTEILPILLYTICFLMAAVFIRKRRIASLE